MPTYEYECRKCGHRFERLQRMTDRPVRRCPHCGGSVRRLIGTGAAVMVKGPARSSGPAPACGRDTPCCGADSACAVRPCDD